MPIRETTAIPSADALGGTKYLVFYSSRDENGTMWCPDCRKVEQLVSSTFGNEGPQALVVYVGQKPEWKTSANPARQSPWKVTGVPTVIKVSDEGREISRLGSLGEDEILAKLADLVENA